MVRAAALRRRALSQLKRPETFAFLHRIYRHLGSARIGEASWG